MGDSDVCDPSSLTSVPAPVDIPEEPLVIPPDVAKTRAKIEWIVQEREVDSRRYLPQDYCSLCRVCIVTAHRSSFRLLTGYIEGDLLHL